MRFGNSEVRRNKLAFDRLTYWSVWFAWHPVMLSDLAGKAESGRWVWLEHVHRKQYHDADQDLCWEYK